mgnify:FL=1
MPSRRKPTFIEREREKIQEHQASMAAMWAERKALMELPDPPYRHVGEPLPRHFKLPMTPEEMGQRA